MVKMFAKTMIKDSTIIKARTTTEAVSDMTPFLSLLSSVLSVTKKISVQQSPLKEQNGFTVHSVTIFRNMHMLKKNEEDEKN